VQETLHHKLMQVLVAVVELEVQDMTFKFLDLTVTLKALEDLGFSLHLLEPQLFMLQVEWVLHTIQPLEQTI
jgi:hypothetical protein